MRIIRSKFPRLFGQKYIILPWAVYAAPQANILENDLDHEAIHTAQMKEMLYLFFYLWYLCEWIVRIFQYRDAHLAYRNISFEREAYMNEETKDYLKNRPIFNWRRFL